MLFRELLAEELNKQRDEFTRFAAAQNGDLHDYLEKLASLNGKKHAEIAALLGDAEDCGAVPSAEAERASHFAVSFGERWANHEEARRWAFAVLRNRTTFAAAATTPINRRSSPTRSRAMRSISTPTSACPATAASSRSKARRR